MFVPLHLTDTLHKDGYMSDRYIGTYNCIGKSLALLVLRGTLADLILNFDISLAPKEDGETYVKQTKACFTVMPGPLYLNFRKRKT